MRYNFMTIGAKIKKSVIIYFESHTFNKSNIRIKGVFPPAEYCDLFLKSYL